MLSELERLQSRERGVAMREHAALQQASKAAALDAQMRLLKKKLDMTEKKLKASDVQKDAARRGKLLADRQLQGFRERAEKAERVLAALRKERAQLQEDLDAEREERRRLEEGLQGKAPSGPASPARPASPAKAASPARPEASGAALEELREFSLGQSVELSVQQDQIVALKVERRRAEIELGNSRREARGLRTDVQELSEALEQLLASTSEALKRGEDSMYLTKYEAAGLAQSAVTHVKMLRAQLQREVRAALASLPKREAARAVASTACQTTEDVARPDQGQEVETLRQALLSKQAEIENVRRRERYTARESAERARRVSLLEDMVEIASSLTASNKLPVRPSTASNLELKAELPNMRPMTAEASVSLRGAPQPAPAPVEAPKKPAPKAKKTVKKKTVKKVAGRAAAKGKAKVAGGSGAASKPPSRASFQPKVTTMSATFGNTVGGQSGFKSSTAQRSAMDRKYGGRTVTRSTKTYFLGSTQ